MRENHANFVSHRCERPKELAVRKYLDSYAAGFGWSIWYCGWDYEYDIATFNLGATQIKFCPWCGKELENGSDNA